jgi:hypothetical protein
VGVPCSASPGRLHERTAVLGARALAIIARKLARAEDVASNNLCACQCADVRQARPTRSGARGRAFAHQFNAVAGEGDARVSSLLRLLRLCIRRVAALLRRLLGCRRRARATTLRNLHDGHLRLLAVNLLPLFLAAIMHSSVLSLS